MKTRFVCYFATAASTLSGCASQQIAQSIYVNNGVGSQYGNFEMHAVGETVSPTGDRCVIFDQDRPLSNGFALRVKTESCGNPKKMECTEISRTVIRLSDSSLKSS